MTIVENRPIDGSNMEKADENYKKIIQEANYPQDCCDSTPSIYDVKQLLVTKQSSQDN